MIDTDMNMWYNHVMDRIKHNVTLSDDITKLVDELIAAYEQQQGVKLSRPQTIAYAARLALANIRKLAEQEQVRGKEDA